MCRKPCRECPWVVDKKSSHDKNWVDHVDVMTKLGQIKDRKHACHMITSDAWGYKNKIEESNVCIGSLNNSINNGNRNNY